MMFCRTVGIAVLGLAFANSQKSNVGIKHVLDLEKYPQARCLDGTPGGFYVYGNGSTNSKWYIHHTGGGWCSTRVGYQQGSTADNCHHRKFTMMGSSSDKFYGPTIEDFGGDYGSGDPAKNPMMHDWNKVKLIYCDGGSFSGRNQSVANDLHFKGSFILEAIIDTLKAEYGLGHASDVVVSGGSAGGLATYLHVNQWRDSLPLSTFVVAMPDGGFFLDWASSKPDTSAHSYAYELRADFQDFNASVNKECIAATKSSGIDESVCMFAEHTVAFIRTPLFALQSVVDSGSSAMSLDSGTLCTQMNTVSLLHHASLPHSVTAQTEAVSSTVACIIVACGMSLLLMECAWPMPSLSGTLLSELLGRKSRPQLARGSGGKRRRSHAKNVVARVGYMLSLHLSMRLSSPSLHRCVK
jgi:hypothetical protein